MSSNRLNVISYKKKELLVIKQKKLRKTNTLVPTYNNDFPTQFCLKALTTLLKNSVIDGCEASIYSCRGVSDFLSFYKVNIT